MVPSSTVTEALRERFGKYHVLDKIAQGGMAEVYKVKTVGIAGFEKIQALKRILPHSAREGRFIRSFIDEARIAVELAHRNIVQVFDFGKADGELFLAMELIEGKDLRTAMGLAVARDALAPTQVAAYVIGEVASGLDYAHRKTDGYGGGLGIVHCDVSPSNVMLSTDGYVKILDFGIARATFASALERRRLRGKPRYMAPEQTLGEPPTAASDVFALGIIAWELFTGLPLYKGPDIKSILEMVRRMTPQRIDTIRPDIPTEIVDAVATALARDPAKRGTAADLNAACARVALASGARQLAAWLADLDARPSQRAIDADWQPLATSMSVPKPTGSVSRSVSRSVSGIGSQYGVRTATVSLDDASPPAPELGTGTPGFKTVPTEKFERIETQPVIRFGDRDPTMTPHPADQFAEATNPVTHVEIRRSFAKLEVQALLRADEDTQHGVAPFAEELGAGTSYESLEIESAAPEMAEVVADEPIDDDLGAMASGAVAERRRVVVVAGCLDGAAPEVLRPIAKSLGELAYQRGGVVIAEDADAIVIGFGLEIAGEDDLAVAMGWALDAAAMVRDARPEGGDGAVLRVGARTGVATSESGIPRDALDEARAIAREATPERPMFVGTTGRLTSSLYALREVAAPRRVARRSRVIEVVGPRSFGERDRARFERRGKFIGRAAQLAELEVWFQRAIAADRRLGLAVIGAAGTGKSRLIAEFIARRTAANLPMRVVTSAASPASKLSPFALVIDLYQAALGLPPARGRNARVQVAQRLQHLMTQAGAPAERARIVATDVDRAMELRDGVGVGAPEVADLRPRISAGLAAFRAAMADRKRPMLTIIEDVHQGDSASLEVLRHTLAVPGLGAELLVLTARSDGATPPAVDVVLNVGDLVGAELRALIADRLGELATPLNIAAVLGRGGGNPLFVEELAQAVREHGDDVPASARDVIASRVDRLSPTARAMLRHAAVLGSDVRVRILEELVSDQAEARDTELDELVEAGFLVRPETGDNLHFARGLVREVVYESLSARAQRETNARIGRLFASRFFAGREEPPAVIAEHLERGGETAGAAAFWLRAGKLALTASDADTAIGYFTRTLALERELGATPPTHTSRARRREALAGREEAHRLTGDLAANPTDLDELQRLCEGEPARLSDVAIRRAQRMLRLGDYAHAHVATVVAEDQGAHAGDDKLRGEALRIRGEILERVGRFDDALLVVGQARDLFHRRRAVHDEMAAMVGQGRIHLMRAHYEQARDAYRPVIAMIDKTGDPWLERIVKNHVAIIEMCLGNFGEAMACAERSLELCRRYGDRAREGDAISVMGIIQLECGLYDHAAATFAEALDILARVSSRWSRADCLIYAGSCDIKRGHATGLAKIDEALGEARRLGARYLEANALVARAGAHLRQNHLDAAMTDAADATAVAQAATLVGYEIQGLARHALALSRLGRHAPAAVHVQRALASLEQQRFLEGSEEEVYVACIEVLRAGGAEERADIVALRGKSSATRKLASLADPVWRAAYAAIPEVRALLD